MKTSTNANTAKSNILNLDDNNIAKINTLGEVAKAIKQYETENENLNVQITNTELKLKSFEESKPAKVQKAEQENVKLNEMLTKLGHSTEKIEKLTIPKQLGSIITDLENDYGITKSTSGDFLAISDRDKIYKVLIDETKYKQLIDKIKANIGKYPGGAEDFIKHIKNMLIGYLEKQQKGNNQIISNYENQKQSLIKAITQKKSKLSANNGILEKLRSREKEIKINQEKDDVIQQILALNKTEDENNLKTKKIEDLNKILEQEKQEDKEHQERQKRAVTICKGIDKMEELIKKKLEVAKQIKNSITNNPNYNRVKDRKGDKGFSNFEQELASRYSRYADTYSQFKTAYLDKYYNNVKDYILNPDQNTYIKGNLDIYEKIGKGEIGKSDQDLEHLLYQKFNNLSDGNLTQPYDLDELEKTFNELVAKQQQEEKEKQEAIQQQQEVKEQEKQEANQQQGVQQTELNDESKDNSNVEEYHDENEEEHGEDFGNKEGNEEENLHDNENNDNENNNIQNNNDTTGVFQESGLNQESQNVNLQNNTEANNSANNHTEGLLNMNNGEGFNGGQPLNSGDDNLNNNNLDSNEENEAENGGFANPFKGVFGDNISEQNEEHKHNVEEHFDEENNGEGAGEHQDNDFQNKPNNEEGWAETDLENFLNDPNPVENSSNHKGYNNVKANNLVPSNETNNAVSNNINSNNTEGSHGNNIDFYHSNGQAEQPESSFYGLGNSGDNGQINNVNNANNANNNGSGYGDDFSNNGQGIGFYGEGNLNNNSQEQQNNNNLQYQSSNHAGEVFDVDHNNQQNGGTFGKNNYGKNGYFYNQSVNNGGFSQTIGNDNNPMLQNENNYTSSTSADSNFVKNNQNNFDFVSKHGYNSGWHNMTTTNKDSEVFFTSTPGSIWESNDEQIKKDSNEYPIFADNYKTLTSVGTTTKQNTSKTGAYTKENMEYLTNEKMEQGNMHHQKTEDFLQDIEVERGSMSDLLRGDICSVFTDRFKNELAKLQDQMATDGTKDVRNFIESIASKLRRFGKNVDSFDINGIKNAVDGLSDEEKMVFFNQLDTNFPNLFKGERTNVRATIDNYKRAMDDAISAKEDAAKNATTNEKFTKSIQNGIDFYKQEYERLKTEYYDSIWGGFRAFFHMESAAMKIAKKELNKQRELMKAKIADSTETIKKALGAKEVGGKFEIDPEDKKTASRILEGLVEAKLDKVNDASKINTQLEKFDVKLDANGRETINKQTTLLKLDNDLIKEADNQYTAGVSNAIGNKKKIDGLMKNF